MTAPTIKTSTYSWFRDKHGRHDNSQFITDAGNLHYDPNTAEIRIGDGATPGGIPLGGSLDNVDLSLYYTKSETDQKIVDLYGTAAANTTLGSLEKRIVNNVTAYNNLLTSFNNINDTDDQTLSLDVPNKKIAISDGNDVTIVLPSKIKQHLQIDFGYQFYAAQSSAPWWVSGTVSRMIPKAPTVVKNIGGLYTPNTRTPITLDPNRTYKITVRTNTSKIDNVTSNGGPFNDFSVSSHIFMFPALVDPRYDYSSGLWRAINLGGIQTVKGWDYYAWNFTPPTYRSAFGISEIVVNLNKSTYASSFSGGPYSTFNLGLMLYADAQFSWSGSMTVVSLD